MSDSFILWANTLPNILYTDLPQIITPAINFTVNEDNSVTLNCSASGIPAPTISWFRVDQNGSATSITDARFSISPSQVNDSYKLSDSRGTGFLVTSRLTVSTTQDADSGQYQCQAENDVGNTTREFELVVQSKSVIVGRFARICHVNNHKVMCFFTDSLIYI